MIRIIKLRLLLLAMIAVTTIQTEAQGWMQKYSPDGLLWISNVYPTHDGGYMATGWGEGSFGSTFQRFIKTDAGGNVLWQSDIDSIHSAICSNITQDGGFISEGEGPSDVPGQGPTVRNLLRVDSNGHKLWLRTLNLNISLASGNRDLDTTDDGGFIFTYTGVDTGAGGVHAHVCRLDGAGNIIWDKGYYYTDTGTTAYRVSNSKDGGFIVTAGDNVHNGLFVFKIDGSGTFLWEHTQTQGNYLTASITRNGSILVLGAPYGGGANTIMKLNQSGGVIWEQTYPILTDSLGWVGAVRERDDNSLALVGSGYGYSDRFGICIADSLGHILYTRIIATSNLGNNDILYDMGSKAAIATADGGFIIGGRTYQDAAGYGSFMIKTDSNGIVFPSILSGIVYYDANNNCVQDSGEAALNNAFVNLTNDRDTFSVMTADSGYYAVGLDSGRYTIHAAPPSPYWLASSCNISAGTLAYGSDSTVSLGITPIVSGPYIVISGYIGAHKLCFPFTYTAQYCNTGTAPFSGLVALTVDTLLTVDSASRPILSHIGNTYTFAADTLAPMQCAKILLYCSAPCDPGLAGRTFCIDAQAYQDTILNLSPLWDKSNLKMAVSYNPATDTITFALKNIGEGGMSGPKGLIVIEDNVILMNIPTQLPAGGQYLQPIKANGATWRATIQQTDYNPYSTFTTAAIEGAGTNSGGGVSLGYFTQYPYNGYTSYEYNTCLHFGTSFDPNGKTVTPEGEGASHLVDTSVVLEYAIDFQNTGTAPATVVKVTDTLAPYLDPSSIRLEVSSAACQMQLSGTNVVSFTFLNINLPDSGAGQQASTGFVKFSIHQKPNNAPATVINNKAGVYFDYNAPIITNTATVQTGKVLVTGIQSIYKDKALVISAYPNPFVTTTTIQVSGEDFKDLLLTVYDISGKIVKQQHAYNANAVQLDRIGLTSGDYIFDLTGDNKPVGNGKIVMQ